MLIERKLMALVASLHRASMPAAGGQTRALAGGIVVLGLLGLALTGDRAVLAARPGVAYLAAGRGIVSVSVQASDAGSPPGDVSAAIAAAVYPPPRSVPAGVSICGPLFSNSSLPSCQVGGTTISQQQGLGSYGLTIAAPKGGRFPNLKREITISQESAAGLYMVLAHAKVDGLLLDTQVIPLDQLQRTLSVALRAGNVYRIEVDQKTGNLDYRDDVVGAASFTYVP